MTWLIVAIWVGLLAAWLAYVLYDDAKASLDRLRDRSARTEDRRDFEDWS